MSNLKLTTLKFIILIISSISNPIFSSETYLEFLYTFDKSESGYRDFVQWLHTHQRISVKEWITNENRALQEELLKNVGKEFDLHDEALKEILNYYLANLRITDSKNAVVKTSEKELRQLCKDISSKIRTPVPLCVRWGESQGNEVERNFYFVHATNEFFVKPVYLKIDPTFFSSDEEIQQAIIKHELFHVEGQHLEQVFLLRCFAGGGFFKSDSWIKLRQAQEFQADLIPAAESVEDAERALKWRKKRYEDSDRNGTAELEDQTHPPVKLRYKAMRTLANLLKYEKNVH